MASKPLRDLKPGDVVDDYGTHRTVKEVHQQIASNGYPIVAVIYTEGEPLTQDATYKVEVVEP